MSFRKRRHGGPPPVEAVAANGLLDRRALLGRGIVLAGAAGTGIGTSLTGAAAEPLKVDPWSLEMGSVVPPYQVPSRFEKTGEIAALTKLRNAQVDRAGPRLPEAIAVAVPGVLSRNASLVVGGAAATLDIELHHPPGHDLQHLAPHVDVAAIGDEFLGLNHTEFATNRSVMDDLKILLDKQQPASRLNQIKPYPETLEGPHYWRYVP